MHKCILILLASLIFLSCKKEMGKGTASEKLFEENILNRDFIISHANDLNSELTANYTGYVFVLLKIDYYHGPLMVSKGGQVYEGSWTANEDYGKLTIVLPEVPTEFKFLSRAWRFTSKRLPVLKFAPWGQGDGVSLNMTRK